MKHRAYWQRIESRYKHREEWRATCSRCGWTEKARTEREVIDRARRHEERVV